ncbi:MAG: amidohydrolase family protein [Congregibacter sp.]
MSDTSADVIVVENVSVIPMDSDRLLPNQTVVIVDGRVAAMGNVNSIKTPEDAVSIDGSGRFLLPGLADMHAHIYGFNNAEEEAQYTDTAQAQLLIYAATGVTQLRDAGGSPGHFSHRARVESGEWIGPDLFVASPIFEGVRNVWDFTVKVTDPEQVAPMVADYASAGYWGLKVYHTVSPQVFDEIMRAANDHALLVMGHVPFDVGIDVVLRSGITSIEHLRGYDFDGVPVENLWADGGRSRERFSSWIRMSESRRDELVAMTAQASVWNVPTLAINRMLFDPKARALAMQHPRFTRLPASLQKGMQSMEGLDAIFPLESREALRDAYPVMLDFIGELSDAGAGLMIGTDSPVAGYVPGFTVIDEIQSFQEAGLTTFEALASATVYPARYLGIEADRGTVAIGKRADLVLLDKNPLEDLEALWAIHGVFLNGRWRSFSSLEAAIDALDTPAPE